MVISAETRSGFTLIELLVSITIGAVVLGIGTARYSQFNTIQKYKSSVLTLRNNLRLIQTKALTGFKPESCSAIQKFDGYRVTFVSDIAYTAQAICDGATSGPMNTYSLNENNKFIPLPAQMDFKSVSGWTTIDQVITLRSNASPVYYYSVCVTKGGDIKDCGSNIGSPPVCSCP